MTPLTAILLLLTPPLLAATAVGLLGHLALEGGARLAGGLSRRWGRRSLVLSRHRGADLEVNGRRFHLAWTEIYALAGGLVLALLWHEPVLSLWALALGSSAAMVVRRTRRRQTPALRADREVFLAAFRSRYAVTRSLVAALEGAAEDLDKPASPLVQAALAGVRRLRAAVAVDEALIPLAEQGRTLRRLGTILTRTGQASRQETETLLSELETQARFHRRLADRARVTLAAVRITLRVLVAANVMSAAVVPLLPLWRAYYLRHSLTYALGTGLALAGYAYFALRIQALEESL